MYYSSNGIQLIVMGIDCGVCGVWGSCVCNKQASQPFCTNAPVLLTCCVHAKIYKADSGVCWPLPLSTVEESTETIENALHEAAKRGVWSVRVWSLCVSMQLLELNFDSNSIQAMCPFFKSAWPIKWVPCLFSLSLRTSSGCISGTGCVCVCACVCVFMHMCMYMCVCMCGWVSA